MNRTVNINLSVTHVGFGGNSGDQNQYFYAFDQKTIILSEMHTHVVIKLLDSTDPNITIRQVIFSNPAVLKQVNKTSRSITFTNYTKEKCSDKISIICKHDLGDKSEEKGNQKLFQLFNCDPQVINDPVADDTGG